MLETLFFGTCNTFLSCVCRVLLSALLGALLGLERKIHNNALGMRTLILISAATCLMTIMSAVSAVVTVDGLSFNGDPTRITAGIVSGIGFLGGGAIIHQGLNIKGLTTAAVIWMSCALGLTVGAGQPAYAVITCIISILSLITIEKVEVKLFPAKHVRKLVLVFENQEIDLKELKRLLADRKIMVSNISINRVFKEARLEVALTVYCPSEIDVFDITDSIKILGKLEEFRLTD